MQHFIAMQVSGAKVRVLSLTLPVWVVQVINLYMTQTTPDAMETR